MNQFNALIFAANQETNHHKVHQSDFAQIQNFTLAAITHCRLNRGDMVRLNPTAQAQSDSDMFSELEQWIAEHLKSDREFEALAERVHMSLRNFARLYAKTRGRTPAKAVEAIRIDAASRRLEETPDRISTIAEDCGFSDEEQMRSAFVRVLGVPPREYRKHFGS